MKDISIKDYHEMEGVSSSILKKILISDAHYRHALENGYKKTESMVLGDAIHMRFLEPKRFAETYTMEYELYKKATNGIAAGCPKIDDDGKPITKLSHKTDESREIKGEWFKKFKAMERAVMEHETASKILCMRENVEQSFFIMYDGLKLKVRCDFMYRDELGRWWIVDLKTVGSTKELPSAPANFSNVMFDFGYDLQAYMYTEVIKNELPVYGFKFICIDAKVPSGVKIYDIIPGESDWYELGGYRFRYAFNRYKELKAGARVLTYKDAQEDLPLSYKAADALTQFRGE